MIIIIVMTLPTSERGLTSEKPTVLMVISGHIEGLERRHIFKYDISESTKSNGC